MALIIVLNGIELNPLEVQGKNTTQIEIRDSDESGGKIKSVSQNYVLTGAAYDIVAASFIDDPDGKNNSLPVKIYDRGCCETDTLLFEGRLISDNVSWCYDECSVEVIFEEYTDFTKANDCLRSTLIYDNRNGFQQNQHPRMLYCVQIRPTIYQIIILNLGYFANLLLLILTPMVALISAIVSFINILINLLDNIGINISFGAAWNQFTQDSLLSQYQQGIDQMNEVLVGCGYKHPSPLVRSYIVNVCEICGIGFSSTILNNPASDYNNLVYLFAPIKEGVRANSDQTWISENAPIETGKTFLDKLSPVFNARWEIIDNVLYFERKDFFDTGDIYVSYSDLFEQQRIDEKLCLEWRDETRPAYGNFMYAQDAIDTAGNDALKLYNDTVEWNNPFSSLQSDKKDVQLQFGAVRCRRDGTSTDVLDLFTWAPFGIGATINEYSDVLIIEKHVTAAPKLIIWDPQSSVLQGRPKKYNNITGVVSDWVPFAGHSKFNFPMWFNEYGTLPNTSYSSDTPNMGLYGRFHAIDNPKLLPDLGKSFTFSFRYSCDLLQGALNAKYIHLPLGAEGENAVGRVRQISVNLATKTIQIQGDV